MQYVETYGYWHYCSTTGGSDASRFVTAGVRFMPLHNLFFFPITVLTGFEVPTEHQLSLSGCCDQPRPSPRINLHASTGGLPYVLACMLTAHSPNFRFSFAKHFSWRNQQPAGILIFVEDLTECLSYN
jgi:hypothetical protein